jgi:cytochrome P450
MKRQHPPGPRINFLHAIIGQLRSLPFDPLAFSLEVARKFRPVAYYRFGPIRVYQLNHPDLIQQAMVEYAPKMHKPRLLKRALRSIAGEGLLTSDGALWKQQRKLMQPAFRHDRLGIYADIMVRHATRMAESFVDGEIRDIGAEMGKLTLAIVVRSLFGEDLPPEACDIGDSLMAILDAVNQRMNMPLQIPSWFPTKRNLRERKALARVDEMLRILVRTRRQSDETHHDLLSVLLAAVDADSGVSMSDRQLRDEMTTLFGAGQETTANALTWTWYLLARHPEVEVRLVEELWRVLRERAPAPGDLASLPYTEMVVRESMRLYPPAPAFARQVIEDVVIGGYEVPKGSMIMVSTYALHRDARFFPDPERFDPDRFAPGWEERIPRYAYLPFGAGPRVCIGNGFGMLEARLILSTIAQVSNLSLEPAGEIRPAQLVTLRPISPVRMRVHRRAAPVTAKANA